VCFIRRYGVGPYHVQFNLKLQEGSAIFSFVVEIASRKQLPHAVYTFLSLVESNLLDGTSFFPTNEGTIRIGAKKESASALDQKYKAFGYEESVLTFIEESSVFPCGPYSMGFVGLGPALEVFTSEEASNSNRVCFGRVVRGMQTLSRVEDSLGQGEGIDIVEIRHLLGDEKSRDEL
jgi:cyclophilin family peptidyl-prolyl cis-trans isomerase